MTIVKRLLPLLVLTIASACSSVNVDYEYGRASFSGFGKKFAWKDAAQEGATEIPADALVFIHDTIERGLVEKGYAKASAGADFLVAYRVSKNFAIAVSGTNDLTHYEEGTLDVFVTAPSSAELIWRGTAHAPMDASLTPSERRGRLQEVVTKLLKNFPDAGAEAKR